MTIEDHVATTHNPVKVSITLDVTCAASYLGYSRFLRAATELRDTGAHIQIEFLPFELAPNAPTEGQPLLDVLAQAFGPDAVERARQYERLAAHEDIAMNYDRAVSTGTFDAHRLIAQAAAQHRAEPMVARLFRAHFADGMNIGDPAVLAGLAHEIGVTFDESGTTELAAQLDAVRRAGVTSIPVFSIGSSAAIVGAQSESMFRDILDAESAPSLRELPESRPPRRKHIAVIASSIREGRINPLITAWVIRALDAVDGVEVDLIDLAETTLPSDMLLRPGGSQKTEVSDRIESADAFIFVTPEYNHSYPAALKRLIDWHYSEWMLKPATIVAYGSQGGHAAIEHLRGVLAELSMVTTRRCLGLRAPWEALNDAAQYTPADDVTRSLANALTELCWWAETLTEARISRPLPL